MTISLCGCHICLAESQTSLSAMDRILIFASLCFPISSFASSTRTPRSVSVLRLIFHVFIRYFTSLQWHLEQEVDKKQNKTKLSLLRKFQKAFVKRTIRIRLKRRVKTTVWNKQIQVQKQLVRIVRPVEITDLTFKRLIWFLLRTNRTKFACLRPNACTRDS